MVLSKKQKHTLYYVSTFLGILAIGSLIIPFIYEHRGFISYQYDIATSKQYSSYQDELIELVRHDPPAAFHRYREILAATPIAHNTCHGIAHKMGHEAFETFGFSKAMSYQDGICGGGYIHGIIESRFGLLQEKDIIEQLPAICPIGDGSCYHGIGHGLMIATKLNTPASLSYCNLLPIVGRRNCFDGVWMHVFDLEETGMHDTTSTTLNTDLSTTAPTYCINTKTPYKTSCYFYLPRIYAHQKEVSFTYYQDLCESVETNYMSTCAAGTGHSLMKYHIDHPPTALNTCKNFTNMTLSDACIEGGILYYFFDIESMQQTTLTNEESEHLCNTTFSDPIQHTLCKKVAVYRNNE